MLEKFLIMSKNLPFSFSAPLTPHDYYTRNFAVFMCLTLLTLLLYLRAFTLLTLVQKEQGTYFYCQGPRILHQRCHNGAVTNVSPPLAALQSCRSPPAGLLAVRNRVPPPFCCRDGQATEQHDSPCPLPPHTMIHSL